ncbi:ly6/PLAUR domain-containing protein 6B-like [Watersipora subatra]|uniref:ly6/PLAUR domain-containing protein 6B-like n=1 Tax=Watersipora subatra TaxID=2589382 RepID=UPI00355BF531
MSVSFFIKLGIVSCCLLPQSAADTEKAALLCWTCPRHIDNESCNRWAPNLACPTNMTACQTTHMFNSETKTSLSVMKACISASLCTANHVGCTTSDDGINKVCISCCSTRLCNMEVPTDAVAHSSHSLSSSSLRSIHPSKHIILAFLTAGVLLRL